MTKNRRNPNWRQEARKTRQDLKSGKTLHEIKTADIKAIGEREYKNFPKESVNQMEIDLRARGFSYSTSTMFVLALMLMNIGVSAAEFSQKVETEKSAIKKPQSKDAFLERFENNLSKNFARQEKAKLMTAARNMNADEWQPVNQCLRLYEQRSAAVGSAKVPLIGPLADLQGMEQTAAIAAGEFSIRYPEPQQTNSIAYSSFDPDTIYSLIISDHSYLKNANYALLETLVHESIHCVDLLSNPEKAIAIKNCFTTQQCMNLLGAKIENISSEFSPARKEKNAYYLKEYDNFFAKIAKDIKSVIDAKGLSTSYFSTKLSANKRKYFANIGVEFLRNYKTIKALFVKAETHSSYVGLADDYSKKSIAQIEKLASDKANAGFIALIGYGVVEAVNNLALSHINSLNDEKIKVSEVVAHLNLLPESLRQAIDPAMCNLVNNIKKDIMERGEARLNSDFGEVEVNSHELDVKGNKARKSDLTVSEYQKLAGKEKPKGRSEL